jgi:ribosomal protein L7Ae-like RNA K-turn-binding protein
MTIVTTDHSKKKHCLKPLPKSNQQCAGDRAQAAKKKVKLNAGIKTVIKAIDKIIEDLIDKHEISFNYISTMVHLGG